MVQRCPVDKTSGFEVMAWIPDLLPSFQISTQGDLSPKIMTTVDRQNPDILSVQILDLIMQTRRPKSEWRDLGQKARQFWAFEVIHFYPNMV